jgi:hypothetical protein
VCLKSGGYLHVAIPVSTYSRSYRRTLVHEMTHVYLSDRSLTKWLEEALAMRMEEALCGPGKSGPRADLFERHMAWWSPESIQHFWKGGSWRAAGDGFGLSYDLARRIWRDLEGLRGASQSALMSFIGGASTADAGEQSCREVFGIGLGQVAGKILGKGDWSPRPEVWEELKAPSAIVSFLPDEDEELKVSTDPKASSEKLADGTA